MQMPTDPNHYGMFPESFCNQHVVSFQTSSVASGSGVMPGCLDTSNGTNDNLAMLNTNTTTSTIVSTGSPNMISDSNQSLRYSAPMAVDWSLLELQILHDGLNKFANEPGIMKYIKIAAMLQDKTVRDVAMRCQWMAARKEATRKQEATRRRRVEERYLGKKVKDRKDKMGEQSSWATNPPTQTDMRASSFVPYSSHNNGLLSGDSQIDHAMRSILEENALLLNQIEVNILTSQAQKNIDLFHRTRRNINCLQQSMSQMPGIMSKLPPLPVSVDEKLASYVLPAAPMGQILGSSHLKEEPRGW